MVDKRQSQNLGPSGLGPGPAELPLTITTTTTPTSSTLDSGFSPNEGYSTVEIPITYISTNTAGPTVIITTTIVTTVSSIPTQSSSLSSTPIAAIVGGIVGGIVVLLIVLLIYFIRSRSYKIVFGGDSEPDRVINRSGRDDTFPQLDLSDEADNITPFDAYATDGDEGMRQYDQSSFASRPSLMGVAGAQAQHQIPNLSVPPSSASYDSDGQFYLQGAGGSTSGNSPRQSLFARPPQGAALPAGQYAQPKQPFIYDTAPADWHAPRPGLSLQPSTVPSASAISGSAKEREVAGERGPYGLGLVQCKPLECSEAPLGPTGGVGCCAPGCRKSTRRGGYAAGDSTGIRFNTALKDSDERRQEMDN